MDNNSIYSLSVKNIDGQIISLEQYKNKVLLIVNTASKCGFTPQYKELEELYIQYKDQGLEVLGFPCNQFLNQEPGDEAAIKNFCAIKYNVSFPMFAKIEVNGENTHPLYKILKASAKGILGSDKIKWNFTKFLVNKDASIVQRFAPIVKPHKLTHDIEKFLQANSN